MKAYMKMYVCELWWHVTKYNCVLSKRFVANKFKMKIYLVITKCMGECVNKLWV